MQRIGEELLRQRKRIILGEKVEVDKEIEKDTADLKGRDLLTVLVQANMDTEITNRHSSHVQTSSSQRA